uniref:Kunitz-type serine protease inhibitor textilinin-5 n=1 Tax=Pseudonaja textilis textilis TaxID=169397 RepID=VKT5_PSETT|nr:RecName: Full=Kunitz-type serine protease inhibitor textilinin-5; Short=Txln-5; Flags: Precursor [Pseudonaja textilis textilis]AAK95523.1 textilinin [Pseudonaja textilis textilis]
MSSGGLLLLLGLLTLWEVLTPVSSKDRPKFCELLPDTGSCEDFTGAFHYSTRDRECIEFIYGGCGGNANNFITKEECESTCAA